MNRLQFDSSIPITEVQGRPNPCGGVTCFHPGGKRTKVRCSNEAPPGIAQCDGCRAVEKENARRANDAVLSQHEGKTGRRFAGGYG